MRRNNSLGLFVLAGLGIYYLWRNRFEIQEFLESQGIRTRLDTSSIGNAVRSGVAKTTGAVRDVVEHPNAASTSDLKKAI